MVFVRNNLVRILNKYDHNQYYYIGSLSESHLQNIYFSYGMAYGGGGFAISYPLAVALEKMQDRCIQRYPGLYCSDDRMQTCMAELGVPLTKELGFHQCEKEYHVGCLKKCKLTDLKELPKGKWFCSANYKWIYSTLQNVLNAGAENLLDSTLDLIRKKQTDKSADSGKTFFSQQLRQGVCWTRC